MIRGLFRTVPSQISVLYILTGVNPEVRRGRGLSRSPTDDGSQPK